MPRRSSKKEVQAHGSTWERELLISVYKATTEQLDGLDYTSKMDLPACCNNLGEYDVSVKTTGTPNQVCMADCLRLYDAISSGEPFHLTVIQYTQNKELNTKKVSSIVEVDLTNSSEALFGTITRAQLEELTRAVKSVPDKKKPTAEEHTYMYNIKKTLQECSNAIRLDIKCNSTQSRLQCSFNHFQEFLENNPTRVIAKSNSNEFRGGLITSEIPSACRVFKSKQCE